ncbi:hypothetical protein LCGC14_0622160 [marine sediment metagenome]|uniref:BppU N-terminal domain-containing protein n=1 Tax=marine sediment metagenome TaxID=412755 RepID=A0A0F9R4H3_9ZZZZ
MSARVDFIDDAAIEQGATFSKVVTYRDSAGDLVDLTSYTLRMTIRNKVGGTVIATSTGGTPTITLTNGGVAGTITITITGANTTTLNFVRAVYDLEIVLGAVITRLMRGIVELDKEITT